MKKPNKLIALCVAVIMLCQPSIFPTSADSSIVAEFAVFKAAWKGTGENKYFKITDTFLDGSSNGAIIYAGTANLPDKINVSIEWALTNAYTADVSVYAMPLVDTDNDGTATIEETDEFYMQSLDGNKISSADAPNLSDGILIAEIQDYTGSTGGWDFAKLTLTSKLSAQGEKAIFFQTTHKSGSNGLTGNFKNLVIKESTEGNQAVNINKNDFTKSVTFTNTENNNTYDETGDTAALPSGTYTVKANSYAPATYRVTANPAEITVTDTAGAAVSVTAELITSDLPQTNYETVKKNTIVWSDENGYMPHSLNYMDSIQGKSDIAVAGAKQGNNEDTDVYMLVNTENGKFHTKGRQWNMQVNGGTIFKVPVVKDTRVTLDASSFTYTVNGAEFAGTQDYYYLADENGYAVINIINGGYASSVKTTPLSRTDVSGNVSDAENGCIMFKDTVSGDIQYVEITNGSYNVKLLGGLTYMITLGTVSNGIFTASQTSSASPSGIIPSGGEQQTQDITITDLKEYSIGGDAVDIKEGEVLKITDGSKDYDVTIQNGKWSASVPSGIYTFKLTETSDGELSALSQNSFTVLEDNSNIKGVLINHPITAETRKSVTVGTDCDYATINDALSAIAKNGTPASEEDRITIILKAGEMFREPLNITLPYVTLRSDASNPATVSWYYGAGHKYYSINPATREYDKDYAVAKISKGDQTWGTAVKISDTAHDFKAENIRFENSFNIYYTDEERGDGVEDNSADGYNRMLTPSDDGYKAADSRAAQAVALAVFVDADRSEFYNCSIVSGQDTLYTGGGNDRIYFRDCSIEGHVDYIYGGGYCIFDDCNLVSAGYSDQDGGGYITANSSNGSNGYYLFRNCTVKNSSVTGRRFKRMSWGRNWGDCSTVYFMNTKADKGVEMPSGWGGWGDVSAAQLYVYDLDNSDVGENTTDNMHNILTLTEAESIYYGIDTMIRDWTPEHIKQISKPTPTASPTATPSASPSPSPSAEPSVSPAPTATPSAEPNVSPTPTATPTPPTSPQYLYEIKDYAFDADNRLSINLKYNGHGGDLAKLIIASYNDNDTLLNVKMFDVADEKITDLDYIKPQSGYVKLFIWDLNIFKPLAESRQIKIALP